jgi:hypothetical protein
VRNAAPPKPRDCATVFGVTSCLSRVAGVVLAIRSGVQIHTPSHLPAGLGPSLPEGGRLPEVDAEQELLDGFLAKLQAVIRGDDSRRPDAGDDTRPPRDERPRS